METRAQRSPNDVGSVRESYQLQGPELLVRCFKPGKRGVCVYVCRTCNAPVQFVSRPRGIIRDLCNSQRGKEVASILTWAEGRGILRTWSKPETFTQKLATQFTYILVENDFLILILT